MTIETNKKYQLTGEQVIDLASRLGGIKASIRGVASEFTITSTDWTSLADADPFTVSATLDLSETLLDENSEVELVNNSAILFGTYGFAILSVDATNKEAVIVALEAPSENATLTLKVRN